MRQLLIFSTILLFSGLVAAQVTVVSGYASSTRSAPGAYSVPFVPLVTTPSVSLNSAASATTLFAQPEWQGRASAVEVEVPGATSARAASAQQEQEFRFGAARFQSSYGAAELAVGARPGQKAARVYTNQDIPQPSLNEGTVKFGDKTEHLQ
jgi:hypothetical protein